MHTPPIRPSDPVMMLIDRSKTAPLSFLALACAGLVLPCTAIAGRGTWFWGSTTVPSGPSPHGANLVVGDGAKEDAEIAFMTSRNIDKVYGSYGTGPGITSERPKYRAWNAKLETAGIESQLLVSAFEPADVADLTDPDHLVLVGKVQARLIDFNDSTAPAEERFDALHLDVEPQTLTAWTSGGGGTPAIRRAFLDDLTDVYVDIRAALDAGGYASIPIYADIPWSWAKYPSTTIGWIDAADRDAWYADIAAVLDGVSVMTFTTSKDTETEIADATEYERTVAFPGAARVAIQAHVGPGEIWPNYPAFTGIISEIENAPNLEEPLDIENYAYWRYSVSTYGPILATSVTFTVDPSTDGSGGVIGWTGTPGYLYIVRYSDGLGGGQGSGWEEYNRVTNGDQRRERHTLKVPLQGPRGFYQVVEEVNDVRLR